MPFPLNPRIIRSFHWFAAILFCAGLSAQTSPCYVWNDTPLYIECCTLETLCCLYPECGPTNSQTVYYDTLVGVDQSCDTIQPIVITEIDPSHRVIFLEHCVGSAAFFAGKFYEAINSPYQDSLTGLSPDCDGVYTIFVSEKPLINLGITIPWCSSQPPPSCEELPGSNCILQSIFGECDTIVTLTYEVGGFEEVALNFDVCPEDSVFYRGRWLRPGDAPFQDTIPSMTDGCDTVETIAVSRISEIREEVFFSICKGDSVLFEGEWYGEEGTYEAVVPLANGCDLRYLIEIDVTPDFEITVTQDGGTGTGSVVVRPDVLIVDWDDGVSANQRINLARGVYPVTIMDVYGCVDVQEIVVPGPLDIPPDLGSDIEIEIAPNPNDGDFTVGVPIGDELKDVEITVINALGQIVHEQRFAGQSRISIDLNASMGCYLVYVRVDEVLVSVKRVVVVE